MNLAFKINGDHENTKPTNYGYRQGGEFHSKGTENIFNPIAIENSHNVEAFTTPEKHLPRSHYCPKMNTLEAAKGNVPITGKGSPIKITVDFLTETLKTRRSCNDVTSRSDNCPWRQPFPEKLSVRIGEETFPDKESKGIYDQ